MQIGFKARTPGCKGTARQAATKDGFAAKELKEHKGNRSYKLFSLCSLRSFAAIILLKMRNSSEYHCKVGGTTSHPEQSLPFPSRKADCGLYIRTTERHLPMKATLRNKSRAARRPAIGRQIRQAKVVLRELRDTLEDLEDQRDLARAKERNAGKPGVAWESVKKEFGFDF